MVIYGMLRNLGPAAFRGTLNAFFTANNIAVIGGLATSGILTVSIFKLVLFCIPTMIRAGNSRCCRASASFYLVSYTATGIW